MKKTSLEFDPYDYYQKMLKDDFADKSAKLFDGLANQAKVNVSDNGRLVKQINNYQKKIDEASSKKNLFKGLSIFLYVVIVFAVLCAIFGALLMFGGNNYTLTPILLFSLGIVFTIVPIFIIIFVTNKKVKAVSKIEENLKAKQAKLINEAFLQIVPLTSKFNFKLFINLVNSLDSVVTIDEELDQLKLYKLVNFYNEKFKFENNESIVDIYSGNIDDNPYVRILLNQQKMFDKLYTGTRIVTWTEHYRDANGRLCSRTCSDTLVAHFSAPAPNYSTFSYVVYGNGAAPNLKFSRRPSGLKIDYDEKDVEKLVESRSKDIEKLAEKAIKDGKNFTALANDKFDSLFYALDRDNETEFRLLFTPLAQQNMVELITAKEPYGDDFAFVKDRKINYIFSRHASNSISFPYECFKKYYDYAKLKNDFISLMKSEFQSLYFAIAPLLAIPLYQMNESPLEDIDDKKVITNYEAEAFVNSINPSIFKENTANTKQILKVSRQKHINDTDIFSVRSNAFKTIKRVELIPTMCRNGRMYNVPVEWYEYVPVSKITKIAISKVTNENSNLNNGNNSQFNLYRYHNFAAYFLGENDMNEKEESEFVRNIKNTYNIIK